VGSARIVALPTSTVAGDTGGRGGTWTLAGVKEELRRGAARLTSRADSRFIVVVPPIVNR